MGAKKINIFFFYLLSFSTWANNQINRDRLAGKKITTCAWGTHINMKIPQNNAATLGLYDILDKGGWVLGFVSEDEFK